MAKLGPLYHVVDGGHVHQALTELIRDSPESFGGFRWPVVVIEWQDPDSLLSISRMCHEMQRDDNIVDFPVPDVMQNLRNVIDSHCKRNGIAIVPGQKLKNGFVTDVVAMYNGGQGFASTTLKSLCYVTVRLSTIVVAELKRLLTEECEDYCRQLGSKRPFSNDSRPYKRLISTTSLKGARIFLNHKLTTDEDRINVIHRLRFFSKELESFRAFTAAQIDEQARHATAARGQISAFKDFLGEAPWPRDMESLRVNMLRTTLVDDDVEEAVREKKDLLPVLTDAYVKSTGTHGRQRLSQYRRMIANNENENAESGRSEQDQRSSVDPSLPSATLESTADGEEIGRSRTSGLEGQQSETQAEEDRDRTRREEDEAHNGSPLQPSSENRNRTEVVQDGLSNCEPNIQLLEKFKLYVYCKTIQQYEMDTFSSSTVGSFDFVLAEPFQKIPDVESPHMDEKDISGFVQCIRRMMVSRGFCFVFLEWSKLQEWASAFATNEMDIVCDPFMIMKDAVKFQKMNLKWLQNVYEPAIVARKPGRHPKEFQIDKQTPYFHLTSCRMPRWCNVVDGVPPAQAKLTFSPTRVLVRPGERNTSLVMELLQTFCPPAGRVLDPFAGALTTGLACVSTERDCVLLETDSRCLSMALPRLEKFAKSKLANSTVAPSSAPLTSASAIRGSKKSIDTNSQGDNGSTTTREITPNTSEERITGEKGSEKEHNCAEGNLHLPFKANAKDGPPARSQQDPKLSEVTRCAENDSSAGEAGSGNTCVPRSFTEDSPVPNEKRSRSRVETNELDPRTDQQRPKRFRKQPTRFEVPLCGK